MRELERRKAEDAQRREQQAAQAAEKARIDAERTAKSKWVGRLGWLLLHRHHAHLVLYFDAVLSVIPTPAARTFHVLLHAPQG